MKKNDLIDFEESIAESFNRGEIPYPVHFSDGNEGQLIEIFKEIRAEDWVFGSWRMHYHALLKGVPPGELNAAILRGESMALRFPEYRVYGSAIAGGCVPIALGAALAIKATEGHERVWLFVGDMVAESGIVHECAKYADNFNLPLTIIVEDNGVSVCTPTREVWGLDRRIRRYFYQSKWPHCGSGVRVQF